MKRVLPWSSEFCHSGAGSDADKVVEYRAFARMRRAFPQAYTSYEMGNFSRFMIKAGASPPSTQRRAAIHTFTLQ